MASRYSKVQSSIWKSKRFNAAKEYRLEYMYLLTCPHGNSAGLFYLLEGYATVDLQCSAKRWRNALQALKKAGLIDYNNDEIFIRQFLKFNPFMNTSHAKGSAEAISELETSPLYKLFYNDAKTYCPDYVKYFKTPCNDSVETVSTECRHSENTETETETETETNTETEYISVPSGTAAAAEAEADETADKKPAPKDEYQSLFEHYLSLGLIKHKTLTKEMKNAIDTARRRCGYSWDELKTLAERHAYVVELTKAEGQYAVEKRGITEFFGQKVKDGTALICSEYADDGAKWLRYKDGLPKRCADEHKSQYKDLREGYW